MTPKRPRDIDRRLSLCQRGESLELVRGMHGPPHRVFRQAQLRRIVAIDDQARYAMALRQGAFLK